MEFSKYSQKSNTDGKTLTPALVISIFALAVSIITIHFANNSQSIISHKFFIGIIGSGGLILLFVSFAWLVRPGISNEENSDIGLLLLSLNGLVGLVLLIIGIVGFIYPIV